MNRASALAAKAIGLLGLAAAFGGCNAVVEGGGYDGVVYGDFGAAEPFDYGNPWYDGGGVYIHPPYGRRDDRRDDHRDDGARPPAAITHDDRGRSGPARTAPTHAAPAPQQRPSIPTAPRPSAPAHGGGPSGGHGGGGGSRGGGGGKDDHRK